MRERVSRRTPPAKERPRSGPAQNERKITNSPDATPLLSARTASSSKQIASNPGKVDWRNLICGLVGADADASDSILLDSLQNMIKAFEESKINMKAQKAPKPESSYQILYRVWCPGNASPCIYIDLPRVNSEVNHLRGQETVSNFELHIERRKELSFVIFKDYACRCTKQYVPATEDGPVACKETIYIISKGLCAALKSMAKRSRRENLYPKFETGKEIPRHYLWVFHEREFIASTVNLLKDPYRKQLHLFLNFIESDRADEFAEVDVQLSDKVISGKYLEYIFVSVRFFPPKHQCFPERGTL